MDSRDAGSSQHWLVVSYFANTEGLACSHHIDDRLELLQTLGVTVSLLTSCCVKKMQSNRHFRVCSLSPSGIRFELRQVLKRSSAYRPILKLIEGLALLPLYPFYWLEKLVLNIDTTWFWYPPAAIRGVLACLRSRPQVVYSTGGAISAHLVARFVSGLFGARWIAEFQDPLIHSYCARSKIEYRLVAWAERLICTTASRVVFLTEKLDRSPLIEQHWQKGGQSSIRVQEGRATAKRISALQHSTSFMSVRWGDQETCVL